MRAFRTGSGAMGRHWNGVPGFGMKGLTLAMVRPPRRLARTRSRMRRTRGTMACTSVSVSPGSPTIR